jgi:predicted N-acetyltransferase YhbS
LPLKVRAATISDYRDVLRLIDGAARWLSSKGTDQWAQPWPDEPRRNARVREDLRYGRTWLATDDTKVAATITIDPVDNGVWPADKREQPALYVRRVIVDRDYGGSKVGACLLDWAADVAADVYHAEWIRVDVWTTNLELHEYYRDQDFEDAGFRDLADEPMYPSRALFQRKTARQRPDYGQVLEVPRQTGSPAHTNGWAGRPDALRPERRPGWR